MSRILVDGKQLDDIELFIFDKDGTLIDVHHYWCEMIKFRSDYLVNKYLDSNDTKITRELMSAMGINLSNNRIKPEGPVGIKSRTFVIETAYKTLSKYSTAVTKEEVSDAFKHVDEFSIKKTKDIIKPLPGVPEFLIKLKKNGIKIALATTDLTDRAELAMSTLKISSLFDIIAGGDLVKNVKPAPDLINYITNKLSTKNKNSVLVGDSMVDLDMAKNAGVRFIGVKTGLYNDDFFKNSIYLVENLNDIRVCK
jgi:HAD superfamily hydrolase (TIGR01509 family)